MSLNCFIVCIGMEENLAQKENVEEVEEEEYVLLNLDEVRGRVDIPPNAPYVLSVCFWTCNFQNFLIIDLCARHCFDSKKDLKVLPNNFTGFCLEKVGKI